MNLNSVVKILSPESGEKIKYAKWCLVDPCNYQGSAALCSQVFFGMGEPDCNYKIKMGKITCADCISKIKRYQNVRL